ncbi:DsbA family protein [Bartonella sp. DGB2]|uniref:DsbA family protein n=1 Tax=Bartonella sp. DGB2 TaxID=3388426 RepID=UPI00398FF5D5
MIKRQYALSFATVFYLLVSQPSGAYASEKLVQPTATVDMKTLMAAESEKDMTEGDKNAPVTIVEYASVTCPHCADFFLHTLPLLREKYIKTGKVRLIFREFAFDPRATAGFMLARCLPEDRYFPMIEVLFQKQMEWAAVPDALTPLKSIAAMAGLDDKAFTSCLSNQALLEKVNASFQKGKDLGIKGVPGFFINGNRYDGELSIDDLSAIIDKLLSNESQKALVE